MENECWTCPCTKKLSRSQIETISKLLPRRIEFGQLLKTKKEEIQTKYNLSGHEFNQLLDKMKQHREFCVNIGLERKFRHLRASTMKDFVSNCLSKTPWSVPSKNNSDKFLRDEIILLETFKEIGRSTQYECTYFAEDLPQLFQQMKKDRAHLPYSFGCSEQILTQVKLGMQKCGQTTYLMEVEHVIHNIM